MFKEIKREAFGYKDDRSDKVYILKLLRDTQYDDKNYGFYVEAEYGRRGSTLQNQRWPSSLPWTKAAAEKAYLSRRNEKTLKGYKLEGSGGGPALAAAQAKVDKEVERIRQTPKPKHPAPPQLADMPKHQLCNPVQDIEKYLDGAGWWMQVKFDGVRAYVRKHGELITAVSRTFKPVTVSETVREGLLALGPQDFVVDGEMCGDTLYVFDLLWLNGKDYRATQYVDRYPALVQLIPDKRNDTDPQNGVRRAKVWKTPSDKRDAALTIRESGMEGLIFKDARATYQSGRPNSGGCAIKYKFVASATVQVIPKSKREDKRSVAIGVLNGKSITPVGTVTIPPNKSVPSLNTLVEVQYLYAFRGGSLVQAVYIGPRKDKRVPDTLESLQYKEEPRGAEAETCATCGHAKAKHGDRVCYGSFDCPCSQYAPRKALSEYSDDEWQKAKEEARQPKPINPVIRRMCNKCGSQLELVEGGKLPDHFAIMRIKCFASGTDDHSPIPDVAALNSPPQVFEPEDEDGQPDENAHLDEPAPPVEQEHEAAWRVQQAFNRGNGEADLRPGDAERFAKEIPKWKARRQLWNAQKTLQALPAVGATREQLQTALEEGELAVGRVLSVHNGKLSSQYDSEQHAMRDVKRRMAEAKQRLKAIPPEPKRPLFDLSTIGMKYGDLVVRNDKLAPVHTYRLTAHKWMQDTHVWLENIDRSVLPPLDGFAVTPAELQQVYRLCGAERKPYAPVTFAPGDADTHIGFYQPTLF